MSRNSAHLEGVLSDSIRTMHDPITGAEGVKVPARRQSATVAPLLEGNHTILAMKGQEQCNAQDPMHERDVPRATRRASITFRLKNHHERCAAPEPESAAVEANRLGPYWASTSTASIIRASSPALSIQSESSERSALSRSGGTRPATFLYTLTSFLRDNPSSPYMRWSEDGTYFIVPDKAGLLDVVVSKLFNQNSYSSFARQLNIYGWRRLQTSPDGKVMSTTCTIWKHDYITRDTPDEDLKSVKRNAQDKSRRNRSVDDEVEEDEVFTSRPRRAITMSSTTAAEALAARAAFSSTLKQGSSDLSAFEGSVHITPPPAELPSVLAPVPTRPSAAPADIFTRASAIPALAHAQNRNIRPIPSSRRPSSRRHTLAGRISLKEESSPSSTESETSMGLDDDTGPLYTFGEAKTAGSSVYTKNTDNRGQKRARDAGDTPRRQGSLDNRIVSNALRVLPLQLTATKSLLPHNPVDVYVTCLDEVNGGNPLLQGRDRLDVPIWLDESSQARFVLAGDVMRAWALWEVVPVDALLYCALADASKPPRPLGIAQQLRASGENNDPHRAYSRERIYLEASGEAGCVGQCRLVFRRPYSHQQDDNQKNGVLSREKGILEPITSAAVPPTPMTLRQAPTSSEREPIFSVTRSGRRLPARFYEVPSTPSPTSRTPQTADAIRSLAGMQALARAMVPVRQGPEESDARLAGMEDSIKKDSGVEMMMG